MIFDEGFLSVIAPEVLHEGVHYGALIRGNVAIYHNRRMLTEDGRLRGNNLKRFAAFLHEQTLEFIGHKRITVSEFEGRACFARRSGSYEYVFPDCLQHL